MIEPLTIERLETIPIRVPLARVYKGSAYRMTHRSTMITRVHTDRGSSEKRTPATRTRRCARSIASSKARDAVGKALEQPLWWNLIANRPALVDGCLALPNSPGLGWELAWEYVEGHPVAFDDEARRSHA